MINILLKIENEIIIGQFFINIVVLNLSIMCIIFMIIDEFINF